MVERKTESHTLPSGLHITWHVHLHSSMPPLMKSIHVKIVKNATLSVMNYDLIQHPSMASSWNPFHLETCWMLVRGSCFLWWESQAAYLILLLFSIWTYENCSTRDVFCLDQWSIFRVLSRLLQISLENDYISMHHVLSVLKSVVRV